MFFCHIVDSRFIREKELVQVGRDLVVEEDGDTEEPFGYDINSIN